MQHELPLEGDASAPSEATAAPKARRPRAPRKPRPPARADMRLTTWLAVLVLLADQVLKYWVVHVLRLEEVREIGVVPPWLNLRMAWNQGVNFGLFASDQDVMRWVLVGVAVLISLWIWIWVWRSNGGLLARISAGLLIGGAIGNVIDRLIYGAVADFLNMSLPGWQNPFSFNVADISIFAGALGLILLPQKPGQPPARKTRKTTSDKTRDGTGKAG